MSDQPSESPWWKDSRVLAGAVIVVAGLAFGLGLVVAGGDDEEPATGSTSSATTRPDTDGAAPSSITTTTASEVGETTSLSVTFSTRSRAAAPPNDVGLGCDFGTIEYEIRDSNSELLVEDEITTGGTVVNDSPYECELRKIITDVPVADRYQVRFTGAEWEVQDLLSDEEVEGGFTITIEGGPPLAFNAAQLERRAGNRCADEGARLPPPIGGVTFMTDPSTIQNGLMCHNHRWAYIARRGDVCYVGFGGRYWVSRQGRGLSCVNGVLLREGQTLSRFYSGHYTVGTGTGQVPLGTYEAFNVENCYWETVDGSGNIIDNNFIIGAPHAEFTVSSGAAGVNVEGSCGEWRRVG